MAAGVDEVVAVGVNCTDPAGVPAAIAVARGSGKPVVVYPNSGERWDAAGRRWTGTAGLSADTALSWVDVGARLVGGCCRVGPASIADLAGAVSDRRDGGPDRVSSS
jgi:homocysteine S-methyltransferase